MKRPNFLAASIALVLSESGVAQSSGDEPPADLPPIVVIAPPLEPPRSIEIGIGGGGSSVYWWDDTEQNGSGGSVSPSDFPDPDPERAAICALLANAGFPKDCNRTFYNAGPPRIDHIQDPWQLDTLTLQAFNSGVLNLYFGYSLVALRNCYQDQANDPAACETTYRTTIRNTCNIFASPFPTARNDMTDRELCLQGADAIDSRMGTIAGNRAFAPWYAELRDVGAPLHWQVLISVAGTFLVGLDQYNSLLVSARKWQNCAIVIEAWDANECGSSLPG
jgi:hypothetical protein